MLALAGTDSLLELCDPKTGALLRTLPGHAWGVERGAAFSSDGKTLVARDCGNLTRLWNVETGIPRVSLLQLADGQGLMISADGHYQGTEHAEDAIVYVAELDDGVQVTLSPSEFAKRFGWHNEPQRVKLSETAP
ncbi:MAG: hypothetical protein FJ276_37735 [Planctomycetes bacterium]|nr:hypothetical protein [Planctomycetota bacterium]